jgi:predicted lipoprotein with Yx(FWY)xxD motif
VNRFGLTIALLAAFALGTAQSLMASAPAPVAKLKTETFGYVLARRDRQALYTWDVERKAGGRIRCTGTCAQLWPPLLVPRRDP